MSEAVLAQPPNSLHGDKPMEISDMIAEIAQYDKIIKLRDEVFAGTHPRIKLKDAPDSSTKEAPDKSQVNNVTGTTNDGKPNDPKGDTLSISASKSDQIPAPIERANAANSNAKNASSSQIPKPVQQGAPANGSSGIDPILLTKSDDLIRAETKLERQRIERALEDQVREKKKAQRKLEKEQEFIPEFDVSEVLSQAQALVKHLTASDIPPANASGSPDDNTFYSSQVNDSNAEEVDEHPKLRATKPCKFFFQGRCLKGNACPNSHDPAFKKNLQAAEPLEIPPTAPNAQKETRPQQEQWRRTSATGPVRLRASPDYGDDKEPGEIDESPNDPPSPPQPQRPTEDRQPRRDQLNKINNEKDSGRQDYQQPPGRYPKRRRGRYSPVEDGKVVRNHITSPVAPQPARVSPLALAKIPRIENSQQKNQSQGQGPRDGRHDENAQRKSPDVQAPLSRKRRRDQDAIDNARNVAPRRDVMSPIPYIKDEPMSPPPFIDPSTNRYVDQGNIRSPILIRNAPSRAGERERDRYVYQPSPPTRQYIDESEMRPGGSPALRRVVSGSGLHYEFQKEPELRRIVSARTLRAVSPQQDAAYYAPNTAPSIPRPISAAPVQQPQFDDRRDYRGSVQPQTMGYARSERLQSPAPRAVRYSPVERDYRPMAPPPRRVVVDQQGNRYYEAPLPAERHESVLVEPRYAEERVEPIPRRASVRPEANLNRVYSDGSYVQRLPSPEPISPRYVEYRPAPIVRAVSRAPQVEPYDDPYYPRAERMRVVDYPRERIPERYENPPPGAHLQSLAPPAYHAYADDQYDLRPREVERAYRTGSTRPEPRTQYVEVHDGRGRHLSVALDERDVRERPGPIRQEYMEAAPRPRYQYVTSVPEGYPDEREYARLGAN